MYWGRNKNGNSRNFYVGQGLAAVIGESEEAEERVKRKQHRQDEQRMRARVLGLFQLDEQLAADIETLLHAVLTTKGFHRHDRGPWRRRRTSEGKPEMAAMKGENSRKASINKRVKATRYATQLPIREGQSNKDHAAQADAFGLAERAMDAWIVLLSGGDERLADGLRRGVADQRSVLLAKGDSTLEKLLVERVLICKLQAEYGDFSYAANPDISITHARFIIQRQRVAELRLATAVKALANVRRLVAKT
jgi:hypothetical protein